MNKKAIGVASNNLGNTMLGMYQEMEREHINMLAGLSKGQLLTKGIAYFHEAIILGEKAYDEFYSLHGWTPICLDFMQHLANRYFNRGLFLLSLKDLHEKPDDIEKLGKRDLQIACDMDCEVISYGEEVGWETYDRIEKIFEVKIVRAVGYNLLLEMGYEDEWDIGGLLDEAFTIIKTEKNKENSSLFTRITYPGRMQEIETELMKFLQRTGDLDMASRVAVRCLHEDEKVFVDTQSRAIEVLLAYTDGKTEMPESKRSRIKRTMQDYWDILEDAVSHHNQSSATDMDSDVISKATGGSASKGQCRRMSSTSWSMKQSSGRFVTMEDF